MTNPHITIDTKWSIGILITLLLQLGSFIWFISKLDSRIGVLETQSKQTLWFPMSEGKLLEQKLAFYIDTLTEIKSDLKEIKSVITSK